MPRKESLSNNGKTLLFSLVAGPMIIGGGAYALLFLDQYTLENDPHSISEFAPIPEKHGPAICAATGAELNAQFQRAGIPEKLAITTSDEAQNNGKGFCKLELHAKYSNTFYDPGTIFQHESRGKIVNFIVGGLSDESLLRLRATLDKNPGPAP